MMRQHNVLVTFGLVAALLPIANAKSTAADSYAIDRLIQPFHPGVIEGWLFEINNQGQATGYIGRREGASFIYNAVIYARGEEHVLATGTNPLFSDSTFGTYGSQINSLGDVVGSVDFVDYFFPSDGTPPVSIEFPENSARKSGGLNDSGHVLVKNYPVFQDDVVSYESALSIWQLGGIDALTELDSLYPMYYSEETAFEMGEKRITGLNNADQFAAELVRFDNDFKNDVFSETYKLAYIYDGQGGYHVLEERSPGEEIQPMNIDEGGTVFGWAGSELALWNSDGTLRSVLPNADVAFADANGGFFGFPTVQRNELGEVVALSESGGVLHYNPASNQWIDITSSISGLDTGIFSTIQDFNDVGQFVGLMSPPLGGNLFSAYVVSPVPEPSMFTISIGLMLVAFSRVRRQRRK